MIAVDPVCYQGRPENTAERMPREQAVYDLLEKLQIPFARVDHEPAMTIEDCAEVDAILGIPMCKNLFLTDAHKSVYYLLLIGGEKQFKTSVLRKQIGGPRVSFAGAEDMEAMLGVAPGSVTLMGLMNDRENRVRLLIDRSVLEAEWLGMHPCVNTSSLRVSMADVREKLIPAMGHPYTEVDL